MQRILLIDDDQQVCRLLTLILENAGFEVEAAASGNTARALLQHRTFDVILTDILMPDGNGLEVIASLRHSNWSGRIIAMTGGPLPHGLDLMEAAGALGADACIRKPFDLMDLLAHVKDRCGSFEDDPLCRNHSS